MAGLRVPTDLALGRRKPRPRGAVENRRYTPPPLTLTAATLASGVNIAQSATLTWAHTTTSGDSILVVALSSNRALGEPAIAGVTYAGQTMTRSATAAPTGVATTARSVDIFTLASPPVGAGNVVVTVGNTAANYAVAASSLAVRGTAALGTPATAATESGTTLTVTTTSPATAIVLTAGVARSTTAITPGAGQTSLRSDVYATNIAVSHTYHAGGTGVAASATWAVADHGALAALPIHPA